MKIKRPAPLPRLVLPQGEAFTIESLRDLLERQVLCSAQGRRKFCMPAATEIAALAFSLNILKEEYLVSQNVEAPLQRLQNRSRQLLAELKDNLAQRRNLVANADGPAFTSAIEALDALHFLPGMRRSFGEFRRGAFVEGRADMSWQYFFAALDGSFRGAMGIANPGFNPGRSQTGILPRFVAAVSPYITGERPTVGTVGLKLKSLKSSPHRWSISGSDAIGLPYRMSPGDEPQAQSYCSGMESRTAPSLDPHTASIIDGAIEADLLARFPNPTDDQRMLIDGVVTMAKQLQTFGRFLSAGWTERLAKLHLRTSTIMTEGMTELGEEAVAGTLAEEVLGRAFVVDENVRMLLQSRPVGSA